MYESVCVLLRPETSRLEISERDREHLVLYCLLVCNRAASRFSKHSCDPHRSRFDLSAAESSENAMPMPMPLPSRCHRDEDDVAAGCVLVTHHISRRAHTLTCARARLLRFAFIVCCCMLAHLSANAPRPHPPQSPSPSPNPMCDLCESHVLSIASHSPLSCILSADRVSCTCTCTWIRVASASRGSARWARVK